MEKIILKIKKLRALQEDAEKQGSLEEAANAAGKVQDLLLKHNLAMAEVEGHKQQEVFRRNLSASDLGWNKRQGHWLLSLYQGIANYNFCQMVLSNTGRDIRIYLMGEPQNLEVVEYLGNQLSARLLSMEKRTWDSYHGSDKRGTFRRGYLMGAVLGIISKLREQREAASRASASVSALVLVQSQKVTEFSEQEFPHTEKKAKSHTKSSVVAMGYRDGKSLDIHKGVGQKESQNALN